MIALDEIDELVADVRAGALRMVDALDVLLEMLRIHEVDDVLRGLPGDVRDHVVTTLRRDFDNATSGHDYFWFSSGRGDQPDKELIVDKVRAWLERQELSGSRDPGDAWPRQVPHEASHLRRTRDGAAALPALARDASDAADDDAEIADPRHGTILMTDDRPPPLLRRHPELVAVGLALAQFGRGEPITATCDKCGAPLTVAEVPETGSIVVTCPGKHVSFRAKRRPGTAG